MVKMVECSEDVNKNMTLADVVPLECQVAGHTFLKGSSLGMFRHKDGYVLKPVDANDPKGKREMDFYESLKSCADPVDKELRKLLPKYFGTSELVLNRDTIRCMVLENVAGRFVEPCVMDVKIGYRTWDPLASEDKRVSEEKKYICSKRDVAFCIPGFQVYDINTGRLLKFGREHGKTLNGETVRSSIKTFLNADRGFDRTLVLLLLTKLWRILGWFRKQKKYEFYSSSLLIAYDAIELKRKIGKGSASTSRFGDSFAHRASSVEYRVGTYETLNKNHSTPNNYEKHLETEREKYDVLLKELIGCSEADKMWANVHMIDFAHVFRSSSEDLDSNYIDGLRNLIKIFEEFLGDSET